MLLFLKSFIRIEHGLVILFSCLLLSVTLIGNSLDELSSITTDTIHFIPPARSQLAQAVSALEGPNSGLIGWWKFDEGSGTTAGDASGGGNVGMFVNEPAWVSITKAKVGNGAVQFDGVNDYVKTATDIIGTNPATISAWIYLKTYGNSGKIVTNGSLQFYVQGGSGNRLIFTNDGNTTQKTSSTNSLSLGKWIFVAATRDANKLVNFYINGVANGTVNQDAGTLTAGTVSIYIGNNQLNTAQFDGSLDDVRIYTRVLSAQEISDLYNQGLLVGSPPYLTDSATSSVSNTISSDINQTYTVIPADTSLSNIQTSNSTVYYVDFNSGSDSNNGLSTNTAWKHLPGTRNLDNSTFDSPAVLIKSGTTIYLKSGTILNRRVVIDSNYYNNGTKDNPIRIIKKSDWGTGPVVIDGTKLAIRPYDALFYVLDRDYITIDGDTTNGIIIQNSPAYGFQGYGGSTESNKSSGLVVKNVKLFNNQKFNVILQREDSFLIDNVEIDGNRVDNDQSGGFHIGGQTYACSNGVIQNSKSYNNGATPRSQYGGSDARIGFWLTNSTNITFRNDSAYNNAGRGFDFGEVDPTTVVTNNIWCIGCEAFNNSAGFGANLDDIHGEAKFYYVNSIARDNDIGFNIYDGAEVYIFNSVASKNKKGVDISNASIYNNRDTVVTIKNSIFYENDDPNGTNDGDLTVQETEGVRLFSDFNIFDQGNGNEKLVRWCYQGNVGCGSEGSVSYYYKGTGLKNFINWQNERNCY